MLEVPRSDHGKLSLKNPEKRLPFISFLYVLDGTKLYQKNTPHLSRRNVFTNEKFVNWKVHPVSVSPGSKERV